MVSLYLSRKSLCEAFMQCPKNKIENKLAFLENHLKNITKDEQTSLKHSLKTLKFLFRQKWAATSCEDQRFRKKQDWLKISIKLPAWTIKRPGRPSKDFNKSSSPKEKCKVVVQIVTQTSFRVHLCHCGSYPILVAKRSSFGRTH